METHEPLPCLGVRLREMPLRRHNFYAGLLATYSFLGFLVWVCSLGPGSL